MDTEDFNLDELVTDILEAHEREMFDDELEVLSMIALREKPDAELAVALSASNDCLHMAVKLLTDAGFEKTAYYMRLRAEENQRILCTTGGLA